MKLYSSNIKKFLIFSQKKAFLIFQKTEPPKKILLFWETEILKSVLYFRKYNFPSSKNKKRTLKKILVFREMELSSPKL